MTFAGALPALGQPARNLAAANQPGEIYRAIGVQPLINARGTFTIITGSQTLPQVKRAMDEASRSYVLMDELMRGVEMEEAQPRGGVAGLARRDFDLGNASGRREDQNVRPEEGLSNRSLRLSIL